MLFRSRKFQASAAGAVLVLGIVLIVLLLKNNGTSPPNRPAPHPSDGFTFFDIGANTVYTDDLRQHLVEILGSDVLETRGTMDLTTHYREFLETHFPDLYQLHQALTDITGARVEHDILQLTFRYALRKNTPFSYVELVFSGETKHPLYFRISAKKEASGIIDELRKKYGDPNPIEDPGGKSSSLWWKRKREVFIVTTKPDRFGFPEFHLMIYFTEGIEKLVAAEETERREREDRRKKALREAF